MTMHLALPLRVADTASLSAYAAGSPAEVGASVALLLSTRIGERRCEPAYGSADLLFGPTPVPSVDTGAIARWEPRATPDIVTVTLEGT